MLASFRVVLIAVTSVKSGQGGDRTMRWIHLCGAACIASLLPSGAFADFIFDQTIDPTVNALESDAAIFGDIGIFAAGDCYDSENDATDDARDDVGQRTAEGGQSREWATVVYERDDTTDGEPDCYSYVNLYPGFDGSMKENTLLPLNEADFLGDPIEYVHSHNFKDARDWELSDSDMKFAEKQDIPISVVVDNRFLDCLGFYDPEDNFSSQTCKPTENTRACNHMAVFSDANGRVRPSLALRTKRLQERPID